MRAGIGTDRKFSPRAEAAVEAAYLPRSLHPAAPWIAVAAPLLATLILVAARLAGV
ncbi:MULTISPECIES: hypothetical protein [Methylobacterium]|uniref:Uncharacterized protein n=1 Tax=Methylobacterium jeotgali TaxID=381630 RepID=A0ABQ4SVR4_9HYPH|nr:MULTISPECIES: hypothetical protein [Methylobacterium]GBU18677.1 hypothetical protein AwMethylo_28920 [Methylobacterium sp.]GJE05990.1 hypothetical protein AOPFMNJM_1296 [Methylobacterium jeotgali]